MNARTPQNHDGQNQRDSVNTVDATEAFAGSAAELRLVAEHLARSAGRLALTGRRRGATVDAKTKASPSDLVTEFDRAAEALIVSWLIEHRPDDGIVGEEGASSAATSGIEWHIDPIDGTTNFVYDLPAWGCSVAARDTSQAGDTLAGAVYIPVLDEMYSASRGQGATLNATPIAVSTADDLSVSLVATGFSPHANRRREQGVAIAALLGEVRDIRRSGSAAFDLCMVAGGRVDAYFETGLNTWDMLAGELIAREAGATSTDFCGAAARPDELVVATPAIHAALKGWLASHSVTKL